MSETRHQAVRLMAAYEKTTADVAESVRKDPNGAARLLKDLHELMKVTESIDGPRSLAVIACKLASLYLSNLLAAEMARRDDQERQP